MSTLDIMRWQIDLDRSPVLYDRPCTPENFAADWEMRNAEWQYRDGAYWGKNPLPAPGVLISKFNCIGNVLVDCYAQTVLPSTHDIDVMWNLSWDQATNTRGTAYVAGIQGWWDGKVGIEKSPAYTLTAATPCPWFTPGQRYHIQAGSVDGLCFIFVDGVLRLEVTDPEPIDSLRHSRVGFEAYQSMVKIESIVVRQIHTTARRMAYSAEF